MKNYDYEANELNLNEYDITILRMYNDFIFYVESLSREQKDSLKIGVLSSLVCLNQIDDDVVSNGFTHAFGTNLMMEACVYNFVSDKDIASFIKSGLVMKRLENFLIDKEE